MKKLLTAAFLFVVNVAFATQYYVDFTGGLNTNTGLSPAQAWKTISKVNGFVFLAGDVISFKCGETWAGETLVPNRASLTFSSYGAGARPIFTGFVTLSSWTNLGSNKWEATVPGSPSKLNMVTVGGVLKPMGRWPNFDSAKSGYRTYSSFVNNSSITDSRTLYGNWIGADIVTRSNDFVTQRFACTGQSGNQLFFTTVTSLTNNYGFFLENSLLTLDQNGEWYYNPATGKITMYYTSTPPTTKVTTTPTLVNMVYGSARSGINIRGINFVGSDSVMIPMTYCTNSVIDSCNFTFAGGNVFDHRYVQNITISNCNIEDGNDCALWTYPNTSITNNQIIYNVNVNRVGVNVGMQSKVTFYQVNCHLSGFISGAAGFSVTYCTIDSIGYNPIWWNGNQANMKAKNNIITNYCLRKNDGGAIYSSGIRGGALQKDAFPLVPGLEITNNIISLYGNAKDGTTSTNPHTRAIYGDATTAGVTITDNTLFSCFTGIYLSHAQYNFVSRNTIFGAGDSTYNGAIEFTDINAGYSHTKYNRITNNIIFAKYTTEQMFYALDSFYHADSIGIIDSNRWINTFVQTKLFKLNNWFAGTNYTLPAWKTFHSAVGYDVHSTSTPMSTPALNSGNWNTYLRFEVNYSDTIKVVSFPGYIYMNPDGSLDSNGINIQRRNSRILIFVGTYAIRPVVSAGSNITISQPLTSATLSGSASDPDGTITAVAWTKNSGPSAVSFTTPNATSTIVNGLVPGIYSFNLKATGSGGSADTSSANVLVTVNTLVNTPPVISPSPIPGTAITAPVSSVSATVSATDPGGSIASYRWYYNSGPGGATISNATTATATFNGLVPGNYSWGVTVIDNSGDSTSSTFAVLVNPAAPPPNMPPVINPNPVTNQAITAPSSSTTATVHSTDSDGTVITWRWDYVSGPAVTMTNRTDSTCSFSDLVPGTYNFKATVIDDDGDSASANFQLIVNPPIPNNPPIISPNPVPTQTKVLPSNSTTATVVWTDTDGTVVSWRWDYQNGPSVTMTNRTTATCTFTNLQIGVNNFTVTVIDDDGDSAKANFQIITNPALLIPPVPNAGLDRAIRLPIDSIHLAGSATDADGTISTKTWSFIGTYGTGVIQSPTSYTSPVTTLSKSVILRLTVVDNDGNTEYDEMNVNVLPALNPRRKFIKTGKVFINQ